MLMLSRASRSASHMPLCRVHTRWMITLRRCSPLRLLHGIHLPALVDIVLPFYWIYLCIFLILMRVFAFLEPAGINGLAPWAKLNLPKWYTFANHTLVFNYYYYYYYYFSLTSLLFLRNCAKTVRFYEGATHTKPFEEKDESFAKCL
jgi:hypothetical protein